LFFLFLFGFPFVAVFFHCTLVVIELVCMIWRFLLEQAKSAASSRHLEYLAACGSLDGSSFDGLTFGGFTHYYPTSELNN